MAKCLSKWLAQARDLPRLSEMDREKLCHLIQQNALSDLIWASGQTGSEKELIESLNEMPPEESGVVLKKAMIKALAEGTGSKESIAALEIATRDPGAEVRDLATAALVKLSPARADDLGESLLSDRSSFQKVARQPGNKVKKVIQSQAGHDHYQAIVLPYLVDSGEEAVLVSTVSDSDLPETTRLGAIEALAASSTESAEDELAKIGKSEAIVEELRKAAWRGLRRSKRARAKAAATTP